jgi:Family of unknown function (DUF6461)
MTDLAEGGAASGWDWIAETALDLGGSFTFARGVPPDRVIEAFGMRPASARLVPLDLVADALHDPDWLGSHPDTEAILFTHTATIDAFHYYVDSVEVAAFEPLRGWERWGTEPDRFLPQMRQAGLCTDPDAERIRDPLLALLDLLTLAFGIQVTREQAFGPLLTVQHD